MKKIFITGLLLPIICSGQSSPYRFNESDDITTVLLISVIVSLVIMYYIIKGAATDANSKLLKQMILQNKLLIEKLKDDGMSEDRINEIIRSVN